MCRVVCVPRTGWQCSDRQSLFPMQRVVSSSAPSRKLVSIDKWLPQRARTKHEAHEHTSRRPATTEGFREIIYFSRKKSTEGFRKRFERARHAPHAANAVAPGQHSLEVAAARPRLCHGHCGDPACGDNTAFWVGGFQAPFPPGVAHRLL